MIQELESVTVTVPMQSTIGLTQNAFVKGMTTPDGYYIDCILYHKHSGQISIEHEGGFLHLNEKQKEIVIDGNVVRCVIETGNELKINALKVEQAYQKSQTENLPFHSMKKELKLMHEYLAESERKNRLLTEKLDSMRKAYQAEAEENARLKNNQPEPNETYEVVTDETGRNIGFIEHFLMDDNVRMLSNAQHQNEITINNLQRELKIERQITGELNEQTRKKVIAWGICLTTAQIVQVVFNYLI